MTVCIGARDHGDNIIMVSDHKVSAFGGTFTAEEAALKCKNLTATWNVMYAGTDITLVPPIVRDAYEQLAVTYGLNHVCSRTEVSDALVGAYQRALMKRAGETHLAPYNMDVPTFLAEGIEKFGDRGAELMRQRIEQVVLDCDFLVCGHDADQRAHIFTVERGQASFFETGYWAIGTGAHLALASLATRRHAYIKGTPLGLFHLCESKFVAEGASDVGRATFVLMRHKDSTFRLFGSEHVERIRSMWEMYCQPRYPENVVKDMEDLILSVEKTGGTSYFVAPT